MIHHSGQGCKANAVEANVDHGDGVTILVFSIANVQNTVPLIPLELQAITLATSINHQAIFLINPSYLENSPEVARIVEPIISNSGSTKGRLVVDL